MTTEKTSKNTPTPAVNDNKTVFGPLGKYAIVAVIMVSIIVTTAIMLNRQLNTVDEQIAAIEEEVTEGLAAETDAAAVASMTAELTTIESNTAVNTEIKEEVASETLAIQTTQVAAPVATETNLNTEQTNSVTSTQFKMATTKDSVQVAKHARHARLTKENQARIDAYKLEQKQYMSDVFARIKTLESQQLNRYKANQDSQIVHLREQISQQQRMIEALALRNKDLFELRAANMQRNQANREQRLNRI